MPFNHYAKIKQILAHHDGWVIKRINMPTQAKNFKGAVVTYPHYYRIYSAAGEPLRYCKFQQIELLARTLYVDVEVLPVIE